MVHKKADQSFKANGLSNRVAIFCGLFISSLGAGSFWFESKFNDRVFSCINITDSLLMDSDILVFGAGLLILLVSKLDKISQIIKGGFRK